ncbi:YebC/PmpR family DNA-binding transcriptional regulator [Patescibacteria group bacterium]|nr:YebC/PmpR family DNA-binding transcriptional regulator [Patescibacteria group bacterium]
MSGHSKWSKVKHQKATTDVVKGQAFTKASRAITMAVREGDGITDPSGNFRLRLAIEKARMVNMPKDRIERAIERGTGSGGEVLETIWYEAFGPEGSALLIETLTDNRQRTVSQVKNILDRHGGSLGTPGSVSYLFERSGLIVAGKSGAPDSDAMLALGLDAGANDIREYEDAYEIMTPSESVTAVKEYLEGRGVGIRSAEVMMLPKSPVRVTDHAKESVDRLVEELTGLDDVQEVYHNVD